MRDFFKRWPRLYYFIANVFGPIYFGGLNPRGFLKRYRQDGDKLNLGSGPRIISDKFINVDIEPFSGVKIVSDISSIPVLDNSVSMIVCDTVFEHLEYPEKVVLEIKRILKRGGVAYISTPFLYPFHSSPSDYTRWTDEGLKKMFEDFEMVEIGVRSGPFSTLNVYLCYLFALIFSFGWKKLFWILVDVSIFIFFPIKFLDIIFNHWPNSINMASVLYCVIKKNSK
jgi:SAM-dependent methyltransferase